MPIPDFNNQGLLPPHHGDASRIDESSPFPTTTFELCQKFSTTPTRRHILRGFLQFRSLLHQMQLVDGFQWVDGQFLEQDSPRNGGPDFIQVVTFCKDSPMMLDPQYDELSAPLRATLPEIRKQFHVDPSLVSLDWPLVEVIKHTRYYGGLLSHQQETGVWKGMLEIPLNTTRDDARAMEHLHTFDPA